MEQQNKTKFKKTEIGMIPEDWKIKELRELFKISAGGDLSKINFSKEKKSNYKYHIYSNSLINKGLYGFSDSYQYEPECVTITGRGDVGRAECRKEPFNAIVRLLVLKPKKEVSCYFISSFINSKLDFSHVGSAVNQLTAPSISSMSVAYPPLPEQKSIAHILSTLDGKIELLQKQNKTLEEIGQAIFKRWFVDFEFPDENGNPYKSSGGKMVYNKELGKEIPEGWSVDKIGNKLKTVLGGTPDRTEPSYWGGKLNWINSGKVNEFRVINPSEKITEEGLKKSATSLLPKRTTILAITGATLGQVTRLEIDSCANQSVVGIRENEEFPSEYIYFWIKHTINNIIGWQTGGAQQHINKGNVDSSYLLIPDQDILEKYILLVKPLFDKISNNCFQTQTLSQIRDSLLPKLMSGKIRVPEEDRG